MSGDFSPEQKRYLEGFVSGLNAARATRGVLPAGKAEPSGPDAIHLQAQDRVTAAGGKLADCKVVESNGSKGFEKAAMCVADALPIGTKTGDIKVPIRFPGGG